MAVPPPAPKLFGWFALPPAARPKRAPAVQRSHARRAAPTAWCPSCSGASIFLNVAPTTGGRTGINIPTTATVTIFNPNTLHTNAQVKFDIPYLPSPGVTIPQASWRAAKALERRKTCIRDMVLVWQC